MNERTPRLDDLVEGTVAESDPLRNVHALLITAGAPPELPPHLAAAPPAPRTSVIPFPRRYRFAVIGAAAALAVALLGAGYAIGRGTQPDEAYAVEMTGAPGASAEIVVLARDGGGNWPMELTVRGLPPLDRGHYELWLTRDGKAVELCGAFDVSTGETTVSLNAPYRLRDFDGWVVVAHGSSEPVLRTAEI